MRFFHLSDLHLGIKLYEHDLLKDQKAILDEIVALTRQYQPDAVVFAGDIYDRSVPPVEAVALFDDFMTQLRAALPNGEIMLISGNHDSAQRLDVFRSELSDRGIHMIGNPPMQEGETIERVTLTDDFGAVNFYLLPFVRPGMVRLVTGTKENGDNLSYPEAFSRLLALSPLNPDERNVLVSHQFFLPDGGDAENIAVLVDFLMAKLSLTREDATLLHIEMWAYVHGIAVLCASGQQNWDDALISRMLTDGFEGIKSRFQKNEQ